MVWDKEAQKRLGEEIRRERFKTLWKGEFWGNEQEARKMAGRIRERMELPRYDADYYHRAMICLNIWADDYKTAFINFKRMIMGDW